MRVLIVAEGKHEVAEGKRENTGALQTIVSRLAGADKTYKVDRLARRDLRAIHSKGRGYYKRALRWMLHAQEQGYNAVVLLVDEDGKAERRREIEDAQADIQHASISRAMGVAIRTFDAWMLADEGSLSRVLGCTIQRQGDPETIADPKEACAGLMAENECRLTQTEFYKQIAEGADLDVLSRRCPQGFAPFASRLRDLAAI